MGGYFFKPDPQHGGREFIGVSGKKIVDGVAHPINICIEKTGGRFPKFRAIALCDGTTVLRGPIASLATAHYITHDWVRFPLGA